MFPNGVEKASISKKKFNSDNLDSCEFDEKYKNDLKSKTGKEVNQQPKNKKNK